jgi:hypothetical protein
MDHARLASEHPASIAGQAFEQPPIFSREVIALTNFLSLCYGGIIQF